MTNTNIEPNSDRASSSRNDRISKEIREQRLWIEAARTLHKASPVRSQHVPKWLAKRLWPLRKHPCGQRRYDSYTNLGVLKDVGSSYIKGRWLDHFGSTVIDGQPHFVTELYPPYITADVIEGIDRLCQDAGLSWSLEATSWWYPGHTIRIAIRAKGGV